MIVRAFVFPTYFESKTIGHLLHRLVPKLEKGEVIIVVDDSPESERRELRSVIEKFGNVTLLEGNVKAGRGFAVWRGMKFVVENHPQVSHLIESDCDGSHRLEDIQEISNFDASKDFVVGSRYLAGSRIIDWSLMRRIMSRLLNFLIPRILNLEVSDVTNGLRRYSRESALILLREKPKTSGFIYLSEQAKILGSHGIHAVEIPIIFASRIAGNSSVTLLDLADSLKGLIKIITMK